MEFKEVIYSYNGVLYKVIAEENIHYSIANNPEFTSQYFAANENSLEIVGVDSDYDVHSKYPEDKENAGSKINATDNYICIIETAGGETEFKWNENTIKLLIDQVNNQRKLLFRDPKVKKRSLWMQILREFEKQNYTGLTVEILDNKFRNLKKTFKHILDNNKKSKTGRGSISWPYYHIFYEIFENDRTIHFGHTISSSNANTIGKHQEPVESLHLLQQSETREELGSSAASASTSSPLSTSSTSQTSSVTSNTAKANRGKKLYNIRKHHLEIEENRIKELKKLTEAVEKSNSIQEKRNELFEKYLNSNKNN